MEKTNGEVIKEIVIIQFTKNKKSKTDKVIDVVCGGIGKATKIN